MHYILVRYRLETIGVGAIVLTVETGKRMTGLLVLVPMLKEVSADTDTHQ